LAAEARQGVGLAQDTEGEVLLVAVGSDDEPEGFVSVWEPDAFIHHLYVRPGSRQKGIGKQLLESLRSRMRKPWRLKCVRANDRALRFYLRHGWLEISSGIGEDGPYAVLESHETYTRVGADRESSWPREVTSMIRGSCCVANHLPVGRRCRADQ
jgi:GNAT superfamily N-acetyltransferase